MLKKNSEKLEGEVEILGHVIELRKIKNPHLLRAIKERANAFLFNYGDHTDHSETHSDYAVYDDYYDHTDSNIGRRETRGTKGAGGGVYYDWGDYINAYID